MEEHDIGVEEFIRNMDDGKGVGLYQIMRGTRLPEGEVERQLHELHIDGVIRYLAAEQVSGQKKAFWVET